MTVLEGSVTVVEDSVQPAPNGVRTDALRQFIRTMILVGNP